jgi:rhodanese-related sulfurtransferase
MAVQEISVEELSALVSKGVVVIDVRETDEYVSGHVPGAVSAPMSELAEHIDSFDKNTVNYVICQAGGRSMRVCDYLDVNGYQTVNVAGGTGAWLGAGYDVVLGSDPR